MEIEIKKLSREDFLPLYNIHKRHVFKDDHSYDFFQTLDTSAKEKINLLRENLKNKFELYLAAFDEKNNFIGWVWGFQDSPSSFYMCNSAVLFAFRRKGIYTKLLQRTLDILKEAGFQTVSSRHTMTNNSVIIPKLKAGFIISKFELDDSFGTLVHLRYDFNPFRKKMLDYRSGQLAPDEEIRKMMELKI